MAATSVKSLDRKALLAERIEARREATQNFWWFCRFIMGDAVFQGAAKDIETPFHRRMCAFLSEETKTRFSVLLAPRSFLKTTISSVCHPIWLLLRDPNERIMIVHGIAEIAERILGEIKQILVSNKRLKWIAPDIFFQDPESEAKDWKANMVTVKRPWNDKVPSILVNGINGTAAGNHFTRIKGDDLQNEQNSQTPDQLRKVIDLIQTQQNMMRATSGVTPRYDYTGTIWDYYDASGWLLGYTEDKLVTKHMRSLIMSCWEPGREGEVSAWPAVKSTEFLLAQKDMLGSTKFSMQFLNERVIPGRQVFRETDVRRYEQEWGIDQNTNRPRLILPNQEKPAEKDGVQRRYNVFIAVDPNTRETTAFDPGVVMTVARDDLGNYYVLDMRRGHPSPTELIVWIRESVQAWKPQLLVLEANGSQRTLVTLLYEDTIKSGVNYPLKEVVRGGNSIKYQRISAIQPLVERGQLFVPRGSKFEPLMEEIRSYSVAAKQDDCLDCLADVFAFGNNPPRVKREIEAPKDPYLLRKILHRGYDRSSRIGVRELPSPVAEWK